MEVLTSEKIFPKVEEIVSSAQKSIKIASAWIKGELFDRLIEIIKRKSLEEFEVILRASEFQDMIITDDRVFRKVKEAGGKIYLSDRLHAKFIIVDNEKAVVGSANFTDQGLSETSGNLEAGIFYDEKEKVEELNQYFEKIKKSSIFIFDERVLGFVLNPVKTFSFEFITLNKVEENSFVEIETPEGKILARVESVYAYDTGFFANPFSTSESKVFAPVEDLKRIISNRKDNLWKMASFYAYLNGNSGKVNIAVCSVIGLLKDGSLDTPFYPFDVGSIVYRASESTLEKVNRLNLSRRKMNIPVHIGKLVGTDVNAYLDLKEVINKHMLVIGTTGSGKSYFVKKLICEILKNDIDVQVFIFDPHGEYYDALKNCDSNLICNIKFPDTLFPAYPEEVLEMIESLGFPNIVKGTSNEAKRTKENTYQAIRPSLNTTNIKSQDLNSLLKKIEEDIIREKNKKGEKDKFRHKEEDISIDLQKTAESIYGSDVLTNQPYVADLMLTAITLPRKVIILDLSQITDPQTRVNIAGLIMQEIFNQNKEGKRNRLIVLEEAHNFAPERGYGEVSAGRDNIALVMARKIASEGRKFNLGLITITQRPAQVSKYVLSQMNTQVMFRTINDKDIDAISTYVEYAQKGTIEKLPNLPTGTGIFSGMAVPFTLVAEVQ